MVDVVDLFAICLFIQENTEADLSLMFLARTAGLSRFRFHRVFKSWLGETLHDFVTRQRMERAAFELSYPLPRSNRRSVKAIAFASGYKSLSSFSHAFSSYAQVSPRQFRYRALQERARGSRMLELGAGRARLEPRHDRAEGVAPGPAELALARLGFSLSIAEQPARRLTVLESAAPGHRGAVDRAAGPGGGGVYAAESLPGLYARALRRSSIAVPHTAGHTASLACLCIEADDDEPAVAGRRPVSIGLRGGRYAVIEGQGSIAMLYRLWRKHFDAWLAETGECPGPDRLFVHFPAGAPASVHESVRLAVHLPLEAAPARRSARAGALAERPSAPAGARILNATPAPTPSAARADAGPAKSRPGA